MQKGKFRTVLQILIVSILSSLCSNLAGSIVAVIVYGGLGGSAGFNLLLAGAMMVCEDVFSAQFLAGLPMDIVDKGIAVVFAYIVLRRLPENMKSLTKKD